MPRLWPAASSSPVLARLPFDVLTRPPARLAVASCFNQVKPLARRCGCSCTGCIREVQRMKLQGVCHVLDKQGIFLFLCWIGRQAEAGKLAPHAESLAQPFYPKRYNVYVVKSPRQLSIIR